MREIDLKALFLGPKGENRALLIDMLTEAVNDQVFWRRNFHPEDEPIVLERNKEKVQYRETVASVRDALNELLADLRGGIPFFSPRYIAHMNSDLLLTGIMGYFAAMLYNPNNVTSESSPITTHYEQQVVKDLCRLVDYSQDEAFGHLTCGGTTANYEAAWVARNLRYFPLAIRDVCQDQDILLSAQGAGKRIEDVRCASDWNLLNIPACEVVKLRASLIDVLSVQGLSQEEIKVALAQAPHSVSSYGLYHLEPARIITAATAHYSWEKTAELLGIGRENLIKVPVNEEFRLDLIALRRVLQDALQNGKPIISTVAVFGSTEEAAVDRLDEIVSIREEFRKQGLDFAIHLDAAYGGYARSVFLDDTSHPLPQTGIIKEYDWPRRDIYSAQAAFGDVDSVTIDPHKLGYVPYPCGAVLFRDGEWRRMISVSAPYIIHTTRQEGKAGPPVFLGEHILEGSKPGAAAAAVYLCHRILPLTKSGYGHLIGESIKGIQQMYIKLTSQASWDIGGDCEITIHPLTRPDLNILCFIMNRKGNTYLEKMNDLNNHIYKNFTHSTKSPIPAHRFFISKTEFSYSVYRESVRGVLERAGIYWDQFAQKNGKLTVLRLTLMHPWYQIQKIDLGSEFLEELLRCLREIIEREPSLLY